MSGYPQRIVSLLPSTTEILFAIGAGPQVVLGQMEVRESMFEPGRVYRAWEVLGGDDISLLVISGAGALALGWMSWRAVRGRWMAALVQGFEDMSG